MRRFKMYTIVILANSEVGGGGFETEVASSSFRLFWIKNNNVDAFDNQYAIRLL